MQIVRFFILCCCLFGLSCGQGGSSDPGDPLGLLALKNDLALSKEGKVRYIEITRGFYEIIKPLRENRKTTQSRIYQLIDEDLENKVQAAILVTSLGPTEVSLHQHYLDYYLAIKEECNPRNTSVLQQALISR